MAVRNGLPLSSVPTTADEIYTHLQCSYPKFFKMDMLCKWAWLSAELLLNENGNWVYEGVNKTRVAVVLAGNHGCLEADKRYFDTLYSVPSPSLFVYTLPNIMLGEISIRHGFKGAQASFISGGFDADQLYFWVSDLFENGDVDACICGWADVTEAQKDICLFWVEKNKTGLPFTAQVLQQLYNRNRN